MMCMTTYTPIPQQCDKLWVYPENKRSLQLLVRDIVCNGDYVNTVIVAIYVVSVDELLPAKYNGGVDMYKLLKWTEETDSRLVLQVEWIVRVKQCM